MSRIIKLIAIGFFFSSLVGCVNTQYSAQSDTPEPGVSPASSLDHIVISEIMAGAENNNNHDFIELYNPQNEAVDLAGFTLSYQLDRENDYITLYQWDSYTLIPAFGHYFLGYTGEDFGIVVDAEFKQNIIPTKGSLALLNSIDEIQDTLCWGDQTCENVENSPASSLIKNQSLERLPGGQEGNGIDTNDNAADFTLNDLPTPQNSGSPIAPAISNQIQISLNVPDKVNPGEQFNIKVNISNPTDTNAENITIKVPVPSGLTVTPNQIENFEFHPPFAVWNIPNLDSKSAALLDLPVTAPWSYTNLFAHSYSAICDNLSIGAVGEPVTIQVTGGSVPIEIAKSLFEVEVVVEGIATMYTDGFYAGSTGTKFYLQDESGGLQVYIPGGKGQVNVSIGDRVRAQGHIELYRGALELIPASPDDVEVITKKEEQPIPQLILIAEALQTKSLTGELATIQGNAARIEEFSYSFEMDLLDETGQMITAYIDKETSTTIETLENDLLYNVTGILEVKDGNVQINPRQQSDIQVIPPAALAIEIDAPSNAAQNDIIDLAFTITNNLPEDAKNILFTLPPSFENYHIISLSDDGQSMNDSAAWQFPLLPFGESKTISATVEVVSQNAFFEIGNFTLTADNSPAITADNPHYIFTSPNLPIWAIQGPGTRSPYLLETVQTQGIITAIFPDLNGFWMQEIQSDTDPRTSAGLFVSTEGLELNLKPGDQIEIKGIIREAYQQTQITPSSKNDIVVIKSSIRLPAPVSLDPPQDSGQAEIYYEALEGMLVSVPGSALAVSPINKYGEITLVLPKYGINRLYQGEENGYKIVLDDGSNNTHLDQSTLPFIVNTGDTLTNIAGPLEYTYGNYKIALTTTPVIKSHQTNPQQIPELQSGQFSIMTWNVENLFDYLEPHPASPALPNIRQYKVDIARTANTILTAGAPSVVALQEIENIKVLEDVASSEILTNYVYQPILIEGTDSRGIDVGYLVRTDSAIVLGTIQHEAPEGITSRPPLEITLEVIGANQPTTLHILNNHFTSMSGGEKATEPRRNSQAAWNVTVMEKILNADPNSNIIITGDLNSYYDSPPIEILRDAGLSHAFDQLQPEERYTYIYEGASQTIDHIMMTQWLYENIDSVIPLHINADYPIPIAGDESPTHKSDHDPVIVILNFTTKHTN